MIKNFPLDLPSYFADAEAGFNESNIVIFGIAFDKTASFRSGSRFGPESIRKASWNFESFNFYTGIDLQQSNIHDYGNLSFDPTHSLQQVFKQVQSFSSSIIEKDKIPVLLGGEHSLTSAVIKAFPKNICVLFLDAHADFRDSYQGESFNHACTLRRIVDHVGDNQVFLCGLRSSGKKEYDALKKHDISFIDAYDFYKKGLKNVLNLIRTKFSNQSIYLTIDIDVFDPAFAPGTGTPEPFGLNPRDVLPIIDAISHQIIGFDIMEVNPRYDHGETAFLGAKLTRHILEKLQRRISLI